MLQTYFVEGLHLAGAKPFAPSGNIHRKQNSFISCCVSELTVTA